MIEIALTKLLNDIPELVQFIGANNVWPGRADEGANYPLVDYNFGASPLVGGLQGSHGIMYPRVTLTVWSDNVDDTKVIGELLIRELNAFRATISGVEIKWIEYKDYRDGEDTKAKAFSRSVDFVIWYVFN